MKYIFQDEHGNIGFKDDAIHFINEADVEITEDIYEQYKVLNSNFKQFKIKNIHGITFEEIFEEYIPTPQPQPKTEVEILKEQLEIEKRNNSELSATMMNFMNFYFEMNPEQA